MKIIGLLNGTSWNFTILLTVLLIFSPPAFSASRPIARVILKGFANRFPRHAPKYYTFRRDALSQSIIIHDIPRDHNSAAHELLCSTDIPDSFPRYTFRDNNEFYYDMHLMTNHCEITSCDAVVFHKSRPYSDGNGI